MIQCLAGLNRGSLQDTKNEEGERGEKELPLHPTPTLGQYHTMGIYLSPESLANWQIALRYSECISNQSHGENESLGKEEREEWEAGTGETQKILHKESF